jgi:hypothetical protein
MELEQEKILTAIHTTLSRSVSDLYLAEAALSSSAVLSLGHSVRYQIEDGIETAASSIDRVLTDVLNLLDQEAQ